jgi:DNA-binding transcriptional LysR family regulator
LTTTKLDSQLATGEVDLAVLNLPAKGPDLAFTPLFEEDVVLVVPAEHPLAASREVSLSALKAVPLLLPAAGTAFRADIDAALSSTGTTLLARAEIDGTRLIASLTFEGWGPSILPATAVPSYLRDNFALVRISEIPRRLIGVVQRAAGLPSAPTRAVLDLLTEIILDPSRLPEGLTPVRPDSPRPRSAGTRRPGVVLL